MITNTRRIQFAAGHRVMGHESKCRHLHGHNYVVYVTATADHLDPLGRVIDFGVLKEKVGGWINERWDHGCILWKEDHNAFMGLHAFEELEGLTQKVYSLPTNPTAENIASFLLTVICPQVLEGLGVQVVRVVVHETENCVAEASL